MNRFIGCVLMLAVVSPVEAAIIITFNGTAPEGTAIHAAGTTYTEQGYSLEIGVLGDTIFMDNNFGNLPGIAPFDDDVLEFDHIQSSFQMTKDDGGLFDLISVETGSLGRTAIDDGNFVFAGNFGVGGTITQTVSAVGPSVQTTTFAGFSDLISLTVTTTDGVFPVMDNIKVLAVPEPNVVPEPSTFIIWSLLGMTVAGISWWKRNSILAIPEPPTFVIWSVLSGIGLVTGLGRRRKQKQVA